MLKNTLFLTAVLVTAVGMASQADAAVAVQQVVAPYGDGPQTTYTLPAGGLLAVSLNATSETYFLGLIRLDTALSTIVLTTDPRRVVILQELTSSGTVKEDGLKWRVEFVSGTSTTWPASPPVPAASLPTPGYVATQRTAFLLTYWWQWYIPEWGDVFWADVGSAIVVVEAASSVRVSQELELSSPSLTELPALAPESLVTLRIPGGNATLRLRNNQGAGIAAEEISTSPSQKLLYRVWPLGPNRGGVVDVLDPIGDLLGRKYWGQASAARAWRHYQ